MSEEYLIERIIEITQSSHSKQFYRKAIRILGEEVVEEELGELKYQLHVGNVKDPAKYFTKLLQNQLIKHEAKSTIPKNTYQELTQQDLFKNLQPKIIENFSLKEEKRMFQPYFPGQIPFPTFIGQEFFTLSKNKKKADAVKYTSITPDGKKVQVSLIRGKSKPGDKPRGIPTVYHGKLFMALIKAWTDGGSNYMQDNNGTQVCFVRVSARKLADYLGWKKFGGKQLNQLNTDLNDLKSYPYYFNLEELDIGLQGFGFYLIGDVRNLNIGKAKTSETIFEVIFSTTVSWQLLHRHTISKLDEVIRIRNEIGWKLRLYLEPRLLSLPNGAIYSINLMMLIKELQLPKSSKHAFKSRRKELFVKAIKELNNSLIGDGRVMKVKLSLNKDKSDYKLIAFLQNIKQKKLVLK